MSDTHNALCPWNTEDWRGNSRRCECALIERVRADERDNSIWCRTRDAVIAKERRAVAEQIAQAIEALPWDHTTMDKRVRGRTTFTRAQAYARAAYEARTFKEEG